jgi:transcriptional regulator with XRE-family HTH domain
MKTVGQIIKEKRENMGWSQQTLAKKTGVTSAAVSLWELNKATPNILTACDLADAFDCTLDELCDRERTKK